MYVIPKQDARCRSSAIDFMSHNFKNQARVRQNAKQTICQKKCQRTGNTLSWRETPKQCVCGGSKRILHFDMDDNVHEEHDDDDDEDDEDDEVDV